MRKMPPISSEFHGWFSEISLPSKYGFCAALLLSLWLFCCTGQLCTAWIFKLHHVVAWKRVLQSPSPRTMQHLDVDSYLKVFIIATLGTSNIITLAFHTRSWAEAQKRSGSLAVIHLLPLCVGLTFSLVSDLCYISRENLSWLHRWIGRICLFHCLLHGTSVINLARHSTIKFSSLVPALLAASSLLLVWPTTLAVFLRRHPQFILKTHYILVIIGVASLGYHLFDHLSIYRWVLLGGVCVWTGLSLSLWIHTIWSHRSWRYTRQIATVKSSDRLLWLSISVPPHWVIRPGQHVQLWMPHLGFPSCMELPVFYVAYRGVGTGGTNRDTSSSCKLHLLTQPQRGLSRRLASRSQVHALEIPLYVLGPFGHSHDFGKYGTVLFVVENLGLIRALPFVRQLVYNSKERTATVRKLEVIWTVEWSSIVELDLLPGAKSHGNDQETGLKVLRSTDKKWIWDEIQQLFELDRAGDPGLEMGNRLSSPSAKSKQKVVDDTGFDILHFVIYCPDARPEDQERFPCSRRIQSYFEHFNPIEEVTSYVDRQRGKMVIAVSAEPSITDAVKRTVQPRTSGDLRLVDLGVQLNWPHADKLKTPNATPAKGSPVRSSSRSSRTLRNEGIKSRPFLTRANDALDRNGSLEEGRDSRSRQGQESNHEIFIKQRIVQGMR